MNPYPKSTPNPDNVPAREAAIPSGYNQPTRPPYPPPPFKDFTVQTSGRGTPEAAARRQQILDSHPGIAADVRDGKYGLDHG